MEQILQFHAFPLTFFAYFLYMSIINCTLCYGLFVRDHSYKAWLYWLLSESLQSLISNINTNYLSSTSSKQNNGCFKKPDFAFQIHPVVLTHHVRVREVMTVKVEEALVMLKRKYLHSHPLPFPPNLEWDKFIAVQQDNLEKSRK